MDVEQRLFVPLISGENRRLSGEHHGHDNSTTLMLEEMAPRVAIITTSKKGGQARTFAAQERARIVLSSNSIATATGAQDNARLRWWPTPNRVRPISSSSRSIARESSTVSIRRRDETDFTTR